eukprot:1144887-Pelagomonas_calceolata.AAC.2
MSGNAMIVERVPCLRDNYVWVLHEPSQQLTAVVDPSESEPVISILNSNSSTSRCRQQLGNSACCKKSHIFLNPGLQRSHSPISCAQTFYGSTPVA